jgi:hypothetical protein
LNGRGSSNECPDVRSFEGFTLCHGTQLFISLSGEDIDMSVEIEGFDELERNLQDLGQEDVPIVELFPPDFMATHTEFDSIAEFFESSPWEVESRLDFEAIPEDNLDGYVDRHTGFNSWESMLSAGAREWAFRQLAT